MEKRTPHCKLEAVQALVTAGKVRVTRSARETASRLGFTFPEMLDVLMALTPADFYKSMTTYTDHRVWQDVYRPNTSVGDLYLKFTVVEDLLIVSFKELSS